MSFTSLLIDLLFTDIWSTLFSLLIGFVVYKLARFYYLVWTLPPGPIPIPILGNLLLLRNNDHWVKVFKKYARLYGPKFTFWIGNNPYIFVSEIDLAKEVFRNNDFSGRPNSYLVSLFLDENRSDVALADFGHRYEALRRVTHAAVQKYARSDKLVYLTSECTEKTVKLMLKEHGVNKEFNPINYLYLLFLSISATIAFGKSYSHDDPEFLTMRNVFIDSRRKIGSRFILWEFSIIFRLLDWKNVKWHQGIINEFVDIGDKKFRSHYQDYDEAIERDFCDSMITAKNDAIRESKESAPYLTDINLSLSVLDLFVAGFDTSQQTTQWMILLMAYYPHTQQKLREEVERVMGDRIPTHEDRKRCHYVMAFISETLRARNVTPVGLTHTAVVDSKIGNYTIPKGTGVFLHVSRIMTDENEWENADEFRPERFLEDGKYMVTKPKAYIPFGLGKRNCLGEKLGIADVFLTWVRFLQLTADYEIVLGTNSGIYGDPKVTDSFVPHDYNIVFKPRIK